ncbi:hypothetical protein C7999DRAFT_34184 [Corynascus novoguineensis]|uniref:Uncharacterized protein n=1 Tax=Corynascus novoguineensis TaxID=1126955 RepID=A0AAN7CNK2_9PEZI|nr:hypothetical protein C7999DRAFT_34184 [Corynascus novoguineensis]
MAALFAEITPPINPYRVYHIAGPRTRKTPQTLPRNLRNPELPNSHLNLDHLLCQSTTHAHGARDLGCEHVTVAWDSFSYSQVSIRNDERLWRRALDHLFPSPESGAMLNELHFVKSESVNGCAQNLRLQSDFRISNNPHVVRQRTAYSDPSRCHPHVTDSEKYAIADHKFHNYERSQDAWPSTTITAHMAPNRLQWGSNRCASGAPAANLPLGPVSTDVGNLTTDQQGKTLLFSNVSLAGGTEDEAHLTYFSEVAAALLLMAYILPALVDCQWAWRKPSPELGWSQHGTLSI